jgi:hypothetical protein
MLRRGISPAFMMGAEQILSSSTGGLKRMKLLSSAREGLLIHYPRCNAAHRPLVSKTEKVSNRKGVNQHLVCNIHTRDLYTSPDSVGALLDSLASNQDLLCPS